MTPAEIDYLAAHPQLKRVTFDGVNDLYSSRWGARTISSIMDMDKLEAIWNIRPVVINPPGIQMSWEMGIQNERCIDLYGCGMYDPC